jgi:hypothetical protein
MPAPRVARAVLRIAPPTCVKRSSAVASASLTRIAEILGYLAATRFIRPPSSSAGTRTVAMLVCGADSIRPGENTITKLIPNDDQSTARRLAIFPVTSRPNKLTVMVSPSLSPKASAVPLSSEISGSPL